MNSNKPKICIADDEPRGRQLLANLLTPEGYALVEAADGEEALATALIEQPDLILLDVMMPKLNGFVVCQRLRADARMRHVPIILLTALDDRQSRLRGLEVGADDFISKPVDALELRTRVRTIVRLNRFRLLSDERERFASAMALSPDAIAIVAPDGKIQFSNQAYADLVDPTKIAASATVGFYDAFEPEPAAALRALAAAVLTGGAGMRPIEAELRAAQKPGTIVEITLGALPSPSGRVVQFILRDITEKKLLEAQLLRSQRIEVLGQLAGGIIHDVNNILAAILGTTQLVALRGGKVSPAQLSTIESSAGRGVNLLRQLLMFARGSDGQLMDVRPNGVLAEVASVVRETFGSSYTVQLKTDDSCPAILADPNQIYQILMNLCVNARDAMPEGGSLTLSSSQGELTASQAAALQDGARAGRFAVLAVRDNGTGIPPNVKARLFDPFFTTKPAGQGTGLGLATVLRLLKRHEGFVHLETEVGVGTCFHCYFPLPGTPSPAQ